VGLQAISEPDDRGYRTVLCTLNGQLRPITVRDRSIAAAEVTAERAETGVPGHVAAPFQGVVSVAVEAGDKVEAGQVVATIEAMKMEAAITAPISGVVERVVVGAPRSVDGGDLLLVLT
jgi:pyruvate carboxylase